MDRSKKSGYEFVGHNDGIFNENTSYELGNTLKMDQSDAYSEKLDRPETEPSFSINDEKNFWAKCNSYWVWEITTCIISLLCLGVVIATLVKLDGMVQEDWPLGIKPASFLSTFVTISRFMMLVGVSEGIGQLRWLYYLGGSRRLDHIDSFESASRGPWGAFLFTFRVSIRGIVPFVARFGALVMIAALAMDPFTQQIVKYETRSTNITNTESAWMPAVSYLTQNGGDSFFNDVARRRSIYGGLLNVTNPISYGCTTGNCTWPDFTSLGYDISCRDVASTVESKCVSGAGVLGENCTTIQFLLPNSSLALTLQNGSTTLSSTTNETKTYSLLQSNVSNSNPGGLKDPTLFQFFIAQLLIQGTGNGYQASSLQNLTWNFTACDVKYCSKLYQGLGVNNGVFNNLPPQTIDLIPLANSSCWKTQPPSCQEFTPSNMLSLPPGSNQFYKVAIDDSPVEVRNVLLLDYNISLTNGVTTEDGTNSIYNIATGLLWNVNITYTFQNVASTLTDYLRENAAPDHVYGSLEVLTNIIEIQWGWFALPAACDLFGPLFLICVIIYTAKGVKGEKFIWKTNTIPLLMHGLEGYQRHGYAGAETTAAIFRKAREMNVQLRRNHVGEIRFVRT